MKTNKINNETRVPDYEKFATTVPKGFKAYLAQKVKDTGLKKNYLIGEALRSYFPDFKG